MLIDEKLKDFATARQATMIDAVNKHGTVRAAADALGIKSAANVADAIRIVRGRYEAARRAEALKPRGTAGFVERDLTTHYDADGEVTGSTLREGPIPTCEAGGVDEGPARDGHSGFMIKGVSTYYDAAGNQRGQWVKTKVDDLARARMIEEAFASAAAELPRLAPISRPAASLSALANLYTITDYHMGMLAWHKEGGADWDLKIAERTLVAAFEHMIANAPKARVAVVNQLGDFLHSDSLMPVTPTSHHILDQDGRFSKMVGASIRVLRRIVDLALMNHDEVHVVLAEGNHDMASSVWLRHMFAALYENEPRVKINASELPFYVYQHGKTMLAFHHGHMAKNESLPLLFASQFAPMWGATTKRYAHCGHRHHAEEKEHAGMTVVQHPTLAARDAYASRHGYMAERAATCITYHEEFGQVGRTTVTPEMLAA